MTTQQALKKAMQLRRTTASPTVTESLHGEGSDGNAFSMYSVTIDGICSAGNWSFEDAFADLEKRLEKEISTRKARLERELAALNGAA